MAKCPNCGRHLRITDWKPVCPQCGVNLNYFAANEKMLSEAEKAEIEHARFQPKVDRGKASFISSKKGIIRLVLTVLPVPMLLLPVVKIGAENLGGIQIYNKINALDGGFGSIFGKAFSGDLLFLALVFTLLAAAMFLVTGLFYFGSLGPHGKVRNLVLNFIQLAFALSGAVTFMMSKTPESSLSFGAFLFLFAILLEIGWNIYINKTGIEVKYTPCYIGGLPKEEYFEYVNQGMSTEEIRRKMLVVLTQMQIDADEKLEAEAKKSEQEKLERTLARKK